MRLNKKNPRAVADHPMATVNHEGGTAFRVSPEQELYRRTCAAFFGEQQFYSSPSADLAAIRGLVRQSDRRFVLALANYARNKMKLRTMPLLLLALAAEQGQSPRPDVREYVPKIVQRADEPAEVIAAWLALHGSKNKMPRALLKGLGDALNAFDEYQLAKHDHNSASVRLRDVIRIVHPVPADESRSDLYKRALAGELKTPQTWETQISQGGSTAENWDAIAPKMGLMALVRNLRNFEQKGASQALAIAHEKLRDPAAVQHSRMLPFRYLSALNEVAEVKTKDSLRVAAELAVQNLPHWPGKTAVFADNSGSMGSPVSGTSTMRRIQIAGLMAAFAAHFSDDYVVGAFGESFKFVELSKFDSVLGNAEKIAQTNVGHATNAYLALDALTANKTVVDRVLIFTDEQTYDSSRNGQNSVVASWRTYRQIAPDAVLYTVNLAAYGTAHVPENEPSVVCLTGWSEGVFEFVPAFESSGSAVETIRSEW